MIINASSSRVWEALTDPKLIKQYLFGTEVSTDWKVGSPITYRGVWNGREYEDKGRIIKTRKAGSWFPLSGVPWLAWRISPKTTRRSLTNWSQWAAIQN